MKLYQLTEQFKSLEYLMDTEELPPDLVRDTLEGLMGDFDAKAIAVAQVMRQLEHDAEGIAEAACKMAERAKRIEARAQSLKAYLLANMLAVDRREIPSTWFKLKLWNNKPSVVVDDATQIPIDYMRTCKIEAMLRDNKQSAALAVHIVDAVNNDLTVSEIIDRIIEWATPAFDPHQPDKEKIGNAFKAGVDVPGAHPEQGQHLRVIL